MASQPKTLINQIKSDPRLLLKFGPWAPIAIFLRHRTLIARLVRREVEARYKGSLFGVLWLVFTPLLMLAVYTFVFSMVFQARWGEAIDGRGMFALIVFSGLIVFNLFAEPVSRAPGLILENVSYVKKVVFPLEILPWVAVGVSLFNALISFVVLLIGYMLLKGLPTAEMVLFPLLLIPVILAATGITWFLSATGVFFRDTRPLVTVMITILMFMSPIFYPLSAVPAGARKLLMLNPLAPALEESKAALFGLGEINWPVWLIYLGVTWMTAWLGYLWFSKTRKGFADVV